MGSKKVHFLIAEDDDDDFFIIEKSLKERGADDFRIDRFEDGESLLEYLKTFEFQEEAGCVVLLDLNMPKKDGRQVLKEVKTDEQLKKIPILILTTSNAPEDILQCYQLGANAYFIKPSNFGEFRDMIQAIGNHWFRFAQIP